MRKIILLVHVSLDGFVAGPDGDLEYFSPSDENLQFVNKFIRGADTALFGRNSYHLLDDFWPQRKDHPDATFAEIEYSNWYNAAHKVVASTTLQRNDKPDLTIIADGLHAKMCELKQLPGKDMIIFGSPSFAESLMKLGLIDEFRIIIYPQFFGEGVPLLADLKDRIKLKLLGLETLSGGEIAAHYSKG